MRKKKIAFDQRVRKKTASVKKITDHEGQITKYWEIDT